MNLGNSRGCERSYLHREGASFGAYRPARGTAGKAPRQGNPRWDAEITAVSSCWFLGRSGLASKEFKRPMQTAGLQHRLPVNQAFPSQAPGPGQAVARHPPPTQVRCHQVSRHNCNSRQAYNRHRGRLPVRQVIVRVTPSACSQISHGRRA